MLGHHGTRLGKVRPVVSSKIQTCSRATARGQTGEELRLHESILVVSTLRPRIRKEHEHLSERDLLWQGREEVIRIGVHEVEARQPRAISLAQRARDAVVGNVETEAMQLGMRSCVRREEVTVTAANFQRQRSHPGEP